MRQIRSPHIETFAQLRSAVARHLNEHHAQRRLVLSVGAGVCAALSFLLPLLTVGTVTSAHSHMYRTGSLLSVHGMPPIGYSDTWAHDTTVTLPTAQDATPASQHYSVDAAFASYYTSHAGAVQLGAAITPAFPGQPGVLQFFQSGALLLPTSDAAPGAHTAHAANASDDSWSQLINQGIRDGATGIVQMPLVQPLLTAGSLAMVGGGKSDLTYSDLRSETLPDALVVEPPAREPTTHGQSNAPVFISEGVRGGTALGHLVPMLIWNYLNSPTNAPDGWQTDYGMPLTEALTVHAQQGGATHALLVQAFWRGVIVVDFDAHDTTGHPLVTQEATGSAYLRTFGVPAALPAANATVWSNGSITISGQPATTATVIAHLGANFPLTLSGEARWVQGKLWYGVHFSAGHRKGDGWVAAEGVSTSTPPDGATAWAGIDTLAPDLASYLAGQGGNVGVVVYDVTRHQYYGSHENDAFVAASSMKVPILLTFLAMTESQGRTPTGDEMNLVTAMIEQSDNDAAQSLFLEEGGAAAIQGYMQSLDIGGLAVNLDAWGFSTLTPLTMVHLLDALHEGTTLNPQDRALALNLMENVESDQRNGVGDTAPAGATVAMKDGWVPGPDGMWVANSSGIVQAGSETYIVAVYSQHLDSLDSGWEIARHVCSAVAQALA